jgi:hypothetical protein
MTMRRPGRDAQPTARMATMALASCVVLAAVTGVGCSSPAPAEERAAAPPPAAGAKAPEALEKAAATMFEDPEAHADQAPHGGVIVPLGAHTAHAEVVIVPDTGELTLYMLDGEGAAGQRIAQPTVVVDVETSGRLVRMELKALPETEASERVGDASRFTARSDDLLRTGDATVTLKWIGVNGQVFADVVVGWPPAAL